MEQSHSHWKSNTMAIRSTSSIPQEGASHLESAVIANDLGSSFTWWLKMIAFILTYTCVLAVAAFSYLRRNNQTSNKVSAAMEWSKSKVFTFFAFMLLKLGSCIIRIGREIPRNGSFWVTKPQSALKKFTCFQRLPPELRQQIWKHASHHARVVTVHYVEQSPGDWLHVIRNNLPPAILQVNSESRRVGLNYYTLVRQPTDCDTFVNFQVDIIYLASLKSISSEDLNGYRWMDYWAEVNELGKLKRLAIPLRICCPYDEYDGAGLETLDTTINDLITQLEYDGKYLEQLILVDESRAGDNTMEKFLITLEPADVVRSMDFIEQGLPEVKTVHDLSDELSTDLSDIKRRAKKTNNDNIRMLAWIDDFSPELKVMQLRHQYHNGLEITTTASPPPKPNKNKNSKPESIKPIHLGKLEKVDGLWGITKC